MLPLVTVIVPVYNTAKYLKTCLDSIVNQTYENLEIILINDGSTDNSPAICEAYTKRDSRITLIQKENQGASSARNHGLEIANGDYISFVDSDDWLEMDAYEHLVHCTLKHMVDAVIFELIKEHKGVQTFHKSYNELCGVMNSAQAVEITILPTNRWANTKLYAKELISDLRFDESIKIGEDTLFACYALNNANLVYYTNQGFYHYVQRENSLTSSQFTKSRFTKIRSYYYIFKLCQVNLPELVDLSLSAYIAETIFTIIRLYDNLDYPDADKIIGNLTRIVRKHAYNLLSSKKVKKKTKITVFACVINSRLCYLLNSSKLLKRI